MCIYVRMCVYMCCFVYVDVRLYMDELSSVFLLLINKINKYISLGKKGKLLKVVLRTKVRFEIKN